MDVSLYQPGYGEGAADVGLSFIAKTEKEFDDAADSRWYERHLQQVCNVFIVQRNELRMIAERDAAASGLGSTGPPDAAVRPPAAVVLLAARQTRSTCYEARPPR